MAASAASGPSYGEVLVDALTRYPAREALVSGDVRMTYAEAAELTSRLQQVLQREGARAGTAVVALSPNIPEVFLAQAAAYLAGACYTGLHALGSLEDHVAQCEDAQAEILLVHPSYAERGAAIAERAACVRRVLTFGASDAGENLLSLAAGVDPRPLRAPAADPEDVVWMPYTGGTTGVSKGVMHTHRSMVQGALSLTCSWELPRLPRYLACAPITHASVLPIVPTLALGGTVVLNRGFDPELWLDTVQRERVNYAFMVPTMLYTLLDRADPRRCDLTSLATIIYGAAPMSASRLEEALQVFGPVLAQGFGQTETLGMATVLRKDEHDPAGRRHLLSSCGRPVAGSVVHVLDDDGEQVADGEIGELCIRAGFTMHAYRNRPLESDDALRGGWLHTGDLGVRDDEGYLHIVDRKRDLIISGAFNIYPRDIEEVLAADRDVSAAAVIGVPDDKWGEAVTAFVVARPGATVDLEALKAAVRERKGAHQVPKSINVVDELPVTAVGKIDKKVLRAAYWDEHGRAVN